MNLHDHFIFEDGASISLERLMQELREIDARVDATPDLPRVPMNEHTVVTHVWIAEKSSDYDRSSSIFGVFSSKAEAEAAIVVSRGDTLGGQPEQPWAPVESVGDDDDSWWRSGGELICIKRYEIGVVA